MQLRLEHLEQGFSVYVNGANSELKTSPRKAAHAEGTHGEHPPPGRAAACPLETRGWRGVSGTALAWALGSVPAPPKRGRKEREEEKENSGRMEHVLCL